jgi:hypothetical protein
MKIERDMDNLIEVSKELFHEITSKIPYRTSLILGEKAVMYEGKSRKFKNAIFAKQINGKYYVILLLLQYKYCTIINQFGETFSAKVEYSEMSKSYEPTLVMIDGNWLSIDLFDNSEEGRSYTCENFRTKP